MPNLLDPNEIMFTNWEPKMANRFIMYMEGIPSYLIKASGRPEITNGKVTIDHINVKRYVKGRSEWSDITVTLYDPIVPSAAQAVMEWVRLSHESLTGRDGYAGMYKKDVDIYQLGPIGDKIEHWKLKGAFITSAGFGDVDWSASDVVEISLTLTYDYAILEY